MILKQKKLFNKKEFEIKEDCLSIKTKNLTTSSEVSIPFEEIDVSNIVRSKSTDNVMLIITGIFFFFFVINVFNPENYKDGDDPFGVFVFLFLVTVICGLITYIKTKNISLIPTASGRFIEVINNNPSKSEQENFLDFLKNEVRTYLKLKLSKIDYDLPKEPQLINFSWLREMKLISEFEYEELKNKLLRRSSNSDNIGFN